jgi:hypothetical protein
VMTFYVSSPWPGHVISKSVTWQTDTQSVASGLVSRRFQVRAGEKAGAGQRGQNAIQRTRRFSHGVSQVVGLAAVGGGGGGDTARVINKNPQAVFSALALAIGR